MQDGSPEVLGATPFVPLLGFARCPAAPARCNLPDRRVGEGRSPPRSSSVPSLVRFSLLRAREQDLTKRQERELVELSAVHSRETQNMLSDFNKAQEVLKDKISALQIL